MERTLVLIKPDAVQRGLIFPILARLEARGLKLVGLKMLWVAEGLARKHYEELKDKPFYEKLIRFITSAPVVAAVFEGTEAAAVVRATVGVTDAAAATPGTIRADWALEIGRNVVHASDKPATAQREVKLWFRDDELVEWTRQIDRWVFE